MSNLPSDISMFREGLFEGKSVAITGGGTGIGFTVARELVHLGANVAIAGRRPEPLAEAKEALLQVRDGAKVFAEPCDTREYERIEEWAAAAAEHLGGLDALVNNAGGQFPTTAQHLSPRGFEAVIRNNLQGTWNMTHGVATKCFIPQRSGRIVNITAEVSRGFPGMVHTGAARAGVENLTKTLSVEWAQFGIRVNAVAPGVIRTSGTKQYPPSLLQDAQRTTPLKRLGGAKEVAHLIVYLCSPQADYVTGQTWTIDGGASLWGDSWPIPEDVPQTPPYGDHLGDEP